MFYELPFSWECHHPNWRNHSIIFRRCGEKPPTSITRPRNTRNGSLRNHNLLGGFNPSEKYESVGMIIPNIWKNKECSKPPTSNKCDRFGWMIAGFLASPFLTTLKIGGSPRCESLALPWLWVPYPCSSHLKQLARVVLVRCQPLPKLSLGGSCW